MPLFLLVSNVVDEKFLGKVARSSFILVKVLILQFFYFFFKAVATAFASTVLTLL